MIRKMMGRGLLILAAFLTWSGTGEAGYIMPLGDSITHGFSIPGGYRTQLYNDLTGAGISFTFVGSSTDNASDVLTAAGQTQHEGHSGYRIDQIANNLDGDDGTPGNNGGFWFHTATPPDVILLHIGTNDILQNFNTATMADRMDSLINQIVTDLPNAQLLVSNIIPINDVNLNSLVLSYNKQIRDVIVPRYVSMGKNVTFVDQYQNFVDGEGNIIADRLPDNIHPDQIGYDLMGDTWAASFGGGGGGGGGTAAVPEPASFLLAALGGLLLVQTARRNAHAAPLHGRRPGAHPSGAGGGRG